MLRRLKSATLALLAVTLLSVDGWSETTRTPVAINWESKPVTGFQTVHSTARVPKATLRFVRDVEGVSTDHLEILLDSGVYCATVVLSSDSIRLDCGTMDQRYMAIRTTANGGLLTLSYIEERPDPPSEAPAAPAPAPKKRVVPPPLPPNAAAKGKVRT